MHAHQVLVPIDFSESSRAALMQADALVAHNPGMHLTLLHVHPVAEVAIMDTSYLQPEEAVTDQAHTMRQRLSEWAAPLQTPASQIAFRVVTGSPTGEIVEASLKADLVVMGTHARAGLSHFFLGSVAERVVQGAHCSVLIVKKNVGAPQAEPAAPSGSADRMARA